MNRTQRTTARATAALIILAFVLASVSNISPSSALTVPRSETVWGSGYWPAPTSFNPLLMDDGQGWDTYLMYEPMFGTNVANSSLMCWLGQSITWTDNLTITIVLRNGIKWSDGSAITTQDVQYTYKLLAQLGKIGGLVTRIGPISNSSMEIVDAKTIKVHLNASFTGSDEVYRQLVFGRLIVPKAVWSAINATSTINLATFANDWNSTGFNTAWKVASGMYLPFWHDTITTITQRNDNWWGLTVMGPRTGSPKYFGYTSMSNPMVVYNLQQGNLDWDGNYVAGLDLIMQAYPFLHTYYQAKPYFPDGSAVLMVPNHMVYPLNQWWLHRALSYVIDYDAMSGLSSGYLKKPSPLYVGWDDSVAREMINTTIEAKYDYELNKTKALDLIDDYCVKGPDGIWWTIAKDPADGKHKPLSKYDAVNNKSAGAWTIIDIDGWTDVNSMDKYAAAQITALLDIPMTTLFLSWGSYTGSQYFGNSTSPPTFDFADYCMQMGLNNNFYERYSQFFTGAQGVWGHYGNYTNPTVTADLDQLDLYPKFSAQQNATAAEIQEIIGHDQPFIPLGGHAVWYIYSDYYWTGWASNSTGNRILSAGPFGGSANEAQIQMITYRLTTTNPPVTTTPTTTITSIITSGGAADYTLVIVGAVIVVVAVVAVGLVLMRRKPGK